MAKPTSIVRVSFIDDAPVDPELSPCHAWLRPWLERNPMHRVSNDLAASYAIAILNPPAPPVETGNGYETDPSVPDNVYQWVYGIEIPGGLDVQLITRGVTGNGPQRAATAEDSLRAVLEVGLSNGDQCPLVPHGVFVNSLWTSLDPRPLSDLELGKGPDGAQVPWIEFVPPASNSIEAEALGHIVMRMDLLRWSIGLMDDRLPDSRIAPPAGTMKLGFPDYERNSWPKLLVRSGGTGWSESHTTAAQDTDLDIPGAPVNNVGPHVVQLVLRPYNIIAGYRSNTASAWLSDPRGWVEELWDGSFFGTGYQASYEESSRRVIGHVVQQPGVTTTDIQPVWSAIEQPLAWIDLQGYVSLQPTAIGYRLEFIRTRMLVLSITGASAAWDLSGQEVKSLRGVGKLAWTGGLPAHSSGYIHKATRYPGTWPGDNGGGMLEEGVWGWVEKLLLDGLTIELRRYDDHRPTKLIIGDHVIEGGWLGDDRYFASIDGAWSMNGLIVVDVWVWAGGGMLFFDGKKLVGPLDLDYWSPESAYEIGSPHHHVLATGEVYIFSWSKGFYYSPSGGLVEISEELKAAAESVGGASFSRFSIFDLGTLL